MKGAPSQTAACVLCFSTTLIAFRPQDSNSPFSWPCLLSPGELRFSVQISVQPSVSDALPDFRRPYGSGALSELLLLSLHLLSTLVSLSNKHGAWRARARFAGDRTSPGLTGACAEQVLRGCSLNGMPRHLEKLRVKTGNRSIPLILTCAINGGEGVRSIQ